MGMFADRTGDATSLGDGAITTSGSIAGRFPEAVHRMSLEVKIAVCRNMQQVLELEVEVLVYDCV